MFSGINESVAEVAAGASRRKDKGHGNRSRKGERTRLRKQAILDSMVGGWPKWEGLKPVVYFMALPVLFGFMVVLAGDYMPKFVLYGVAALLGIYIAISAFRGVELVLAAMLFYMPFSTTYVIPIAPGINGTNMLLALGMGASIMRAAAERQFWLTWPKGTALVFMFAILSTLSGFTVTLLPDGLNYLLYTEILSYKGWIDQFVLYFIALSCIRDIETAKRMVVYMGMGTIFLVLYSVPEMLDRMGNSTIDKSRILGPHKQPNNFGGFVAYTLLPLVAVFMTYIKDIRAWLLTPYFLIAAKVLISTFSRGAYLAMAIGGFLAAYYKGKGFLIFWATLALCFLLAFPSLFPDTILSRFDSITKSEVSTSQDQKLDDSSGNRLILWRAAGKMIVEDPFFGKGFKAFPYLKDSYTETQIVVSDPHNMYLYIASQMGLPALSLYLLIIAYSFHLGRVLSRNREDLFIRAIGIGGASATACYVVICMFGSRAVNLEFTVYFWTYLVCMQVIRQQLDQSGRDKNKPKKQRSNAFEAKKLAHAAAASEQGDVIHPEEQAPRLLSAITKRRRNISRSSMAEARARRRKLKSHGS